MCFSWVRYFPIVDRKDTRLLDVDIKDSNGKIIFKQKDVEAPSHWSDRAATIFADKYFRGKLDTPSRERSIVKVIERVVNTIEEWGAEYFNTYEDLANFTSDLFYILWNQLASFNSPVWFNLGIEDEPQASACFIMHVEDDMHSIMQRAYDEAFIFKQGSGSGANNSRLRGSMERLSKSGIASGPVSFMRGYDAFAGVIKSGGAVRRAAKMEILDVDHPDISEFIQCKANQEKKALILKKITESKAINQISEIYHQNANHSVRVNDAFMDSVVSGENWELVARSEKGGPSKKRIIDGLEGKVLETVPARTIWKEICECAWSCGDPGLFFDDAVQKMNVAASIEKITSSNPCVEFMFLDETSCNLASINLISLFSFKNKWAFDTKKFESIVGTLIIAQDIICGNASYPTENIIARTKRFRPLGLGFSNLGATLMKMGVAYDSNIGRNIAAFISSLMTATGYLCSSHIIELCGFEENLKDIYPSMTKVLKEHVKSFIKIKDCDLDIAGLEPEHILSIWDLAVQGGGWRNAQITAIAPCGTISFQMDCDTTGIEPLISPGFLKKMAGGGEVLMNIPQCFKDAKNRYSDPQVLETALGGIDSEPISPMGHLRMLAAVQPFISGGISKTINLPSSASIEAVSDTYMDAWKMGLKSVALYRDGSKFEQPLVVQKEEPKKKTEDYKPIRRKLPRDRPALTHAFRIGDHKGYITAGMYPNDLALGEIFITMSKQGSMVAGLMDTVGTLASIALQYGVPLKSLVEKFRHTRFDPIGVTDNPDIQIAQSPIDYIFRWLEQKFVLDQDGPSLETQYEVGEDDVFTGNPCPRCGTETVKQGRCEFCPNCAFTGGCG